MNLEIEIRQYISLSASFCAGSHYYNGHFPHCMDSVTLLSLANNTLPGLTFVKSRETG
jgi:hypothetical protein